MASTPETTASKAKRINAANGVVSPLLFRQDDAHASGRRGREGDQASFTSSLDARQDPQSDRMAARSYISFGSAILNCLCAGSITAYSLYGHIFLSRLRYTQLQVNSVSIAAEVMMYLAVPFVGYSCDRYNPRPMSFLSSLLFGGGYLLAAFTYRKGPPSAVGGHGWPPAVMVLAFAGIGTGTCCMYISAVTTCAKNFGRGKHKGLALGLPIAAFGLGGMWQSQIGSRFLYERGPDGVKGDLDVFKYFLFLSILLFTVGLIGTVGLQVVDEEELIDDAVDELERSGLLEDNPFFRDGTSRSIYGTMDGDGFLDDDTEDLGFSIQRPKTDEEEEKRKKAWLLNMETRNFLSDKTMWWLAAGFFLASGPGEAFINNLGTIIGTLNPPMPVNHASPTTAATQISVVAISSTLARIITGTLSDLFAPATTSPRYSTPSSSLHSHQRPQTPSSSGFHISRITFIILSAITLSLGQILLASGLIQEHDSRFWLVSALIGTGHGAIFALCPIICSVIWGVENFGTNWGIVSVVPAFGATLWGLVYSAVYQWAATDPEQYLPHRSLTPTTTTTITESLCYGEKCYAITFWAMALSIWFACGLWMWAWKGPDGWSRRGIIV